MIKAIKLLLLCGLIGLIACRDGRSFELTYTTMAAPEWDALFKRRSGWFGGDGIFAIPLSGKENEAATKDEKTLLLFSDTMVGEIEQDSLLPGYHMVNNSVAVMNGSIPAEDQISFLVDRDSTGKSRSVFVPTLPPLEKGEYYWLGDGFVNPANQVTYIFAYRVVDRPDFEVFGFDILGGAIIAIPPGSRFPFPDHRQLSLPFFFRHDVQVFGSFGAGVLVNTVSAGVAEPDGYIYIYGVDDPGKRLIVARVRPESFEDFPTWTFWDGSSWNSDFTKSAGLTDNVSNELSVSFLPNGKLLLVSQVGGLTRSRVGIRIGESVTGPFGPVREIWDCREAIEDPAFFAYNAKAHPSLSKPGELLISYNVNSFSFWDQIEDFPHLYRPRFLKLIFEEEQFRK